MLPESILEKNEEDVKKPSFWKSLSVGDIWKSKSMRILPEEFVRSVGKDIKHRLVFSVRWGNSWQCWLEREEDGLFMDEEDWNEFVDDNDLAPNDMLCFTHDNSFYLEARIFKNGKEVIDSPLTTNTEPELVNTQPRYYHKILTTDSTITSSSGYNQRRYYHRDTTITSSSGYNQPRYYHRDTTITSSSGYNQPRYYHRDITITSSSVSGSVKTIHKAKGGYDVKDPKRYLSNPESPYFVRKLVKRNDVLYVSQTLIDKFDLNLGPVDSPMTYIVPSGEVKAYHKIYSGTNCFSGWAAVCRANNWSQGDSLVCEFESSSQGMVTALRVHEMHE